MKREWSMIATWRMAGDAIKLGGEILAENGKCQDAVEKAIMQVEDYPFYKSVGYGGLPNEECQVELDAAFMDGKTLSIGAVAGIRDFKNPVSIARKLSHDRFNIFLVGEGAEAYAHKNGFERKNMLTERAKKTWEKRKEEIYEKHLSPYDGHDTVCMIALDKDRDMAVATSTSGLFMKKKGRVGDSPVSGSGFYVDNEIGGAAATGLGEDIMKGCLSYEVVQRMKNGEKPMDAAQNAVREFSEKLKKARGKAGGISIIALNNEGDWGIGTNVEFTFAAVTPDHKAQVYIAIPDEANEKVDIQEASDEYMAEYKRSIQKPLD
ncbi:MULTISPECIES: N(4)-(beta-N-acetylglucosaminyl)-L-asparaginase [unclassified Fusobacterium]|uniref:N(4)-(beta-N-acetylglucosaminyl)-L-asparaginase n=1 Tax=unclassified Fusobacterium TaxID=2648384 RepID=UPI001B8AEF1C|nr:MULTISPECIES: N(4)-(beta-N-acetylglucosaminyl)-L-asparaginase [unclassified Fusobacterium]MBR8700836.1 N(4)-(Beta-N-acetylglucosaminyl)-L-asparaginase [Fusobacterium sp. DD45]MBR8710625.1 N(4)-(Beta-N-acetylglucosaminyl)-L-asparaginase [Fusobacterium sp. DD28]MBR8751186.1 N(4)-(Beta-N-acetylglucosaminyl)-L-asparaginase [Fusobacterium sp. DD26]